MQDPILLLAGGLVVLVVVMVILWFTVFAPRRVDRAFVEFASIVGDDGGNPGFQKATSTGQPQMLINMKPNTELFNGDLDTDDWGYIKTNEDMMTNIDGVYAVGDIRSKKYRQITTAVADGTIAAISVTRELDI